MISSKISMIFFDVDGTLINSTITSLPDSTLEALNLLKQKGYKIGIASGRGKDSMIKTNILSQFQFDGLVLNNGQMVYDQDMNLIFEDYIPDATVEKCIRIATELKIPLVVKSSPRFITMEPNEDVYRAREYLNNSIPEVGIFGGNKVGAMVAYGPLSYDYQDFCSIAGLKVLPGMSSYCDLTMANVSKQTGIRILLELNSLENYIGFGDSLNDIEMMAGAKIAVCMGEGHEKTKEIADHVTSNLEDDGIYNACKFLKLF